MHSSQALSLRQTKQRLAFTYPADKPLNGIQWTLSTKVKPYSALVDARVSSASQRSLYRSATTTEVKVTSCSGIGMHLMP